jgi:hypothetical protein
MGAMGALSPMSANMSQNNYNNLQENGMQVNNNNFAQSYSNLQENGMQQNNDNYLSQLPEHLLARNANQYTNSAQGMMNSVGPSSVGVPPTQMNYQQQMGGNNSELSETSDFFF